MSVDLSYGKIEWWTGSCDRVGIMAARDREDTQTRTQKQIDAEELLRTGAYWHE